MLVIVSKKDGSSIEYDDVRKTYVQNGKLLVLEYYPPALIGEYPMNRIIWLVKQVLPLKYKTHYIENDKKYYCEWRMWFGKCFDIERQVKP